MNQFISNNYTNKKQYSHCNHQLNGGVSDSRDVDVSTGLRLAFNDHHHQQQQHSFNHHPYAFATFLSQDLSNLFNQQGDDIQRYLQAQGDELRRKLEEKTQHHYSALIQLVQNVTSRIISEKESMVNKAARRNAELEARASQLSTEAQVWEAKATAQEAVAVALQAQLQQMINVTGGGCVSQGEEVAKGDVEDAESSYVDPERVVVVRGPGCKVCGKRVASVVLLPCRHLCVCSECDDVVQTCPLCQSFRSSSIEVYMS